MDRTNGDETTKSGVREDNRELLKMPRPMEEFGNYEVDMSKSFKEVVTSK